MNYYSEDIISAIDPAIVLHPLFEDWLSLVENILLHDEFQRRKMFLHHHDMTVWDHSILVSFKSFLVGRIMGLHMQGMRRKIMLNFSQS